jgi:hypothetical protein
LEPACSARCGAKHHCLAKPQNHIIHSNGCNSRFVTYLARFRGGLWLSPASGGVSREVKSLVSLASFLRQYALPLIVYHYSVATLTQDQRGGIMSANDFQMQLDRQLGFIERSCRDFDAGHKDEAIRIAAALRILFYDTKKSCKSLLKHLKSKHIKLLSAMLNTGLGHFHRLAVQVKGTVGKDDWHGAPLLDQAPSQKFIPFQDWWDKEILFHGLGLAMTRRELVLSAANNDGGAHVDKALDPNYKQVIDGFIKLKFWNNDEATNLPIGEPEVFDVRDTHFAALRQLAYEVLNSPELLNLAGRYWSR